MNKESVVEEENGELDQLQIECDHYFDELRKDQTKINTCVHCGYEDFRRNRNETMF